jgi:methanogenic corrinoid protein MtbC1
MKTDPTLSREPRYRIGAVSRATGIAPDTIRMWERRYGNLVPARSDAGGRLYSDADIAHLRLVKQLIDRGHAIGRLAHLSEEELREILLRHDAGFGGGELIPVDTARIRDQFIAAISQFDVAAAQQLLARASLALPPAELVEELLSPMLREVGHRWASGRLKVSHEHTASTLLRSLIGGILATYAPRGGPTLVVTTPSGELHEFGALLAALLAAAAGWHVLYLGPNLPADEILETALNSEATAVALSLVTAEAPDASADLKKLVDELPPEVTLIAGGEALGRYPMLFPRAMAFGSLGAFNDWLSEQAGRRKPPRGGPGRSAH